MGLFVKIVPGEFTNASRDKRELSVVKELGHKVIVVAISEKKINEVINIDGWKVQCRSTRPLGQNRLLAINRLISVFSWAIYVRRLGADYISGHNLTGLLIAWISTWFQFQNKRRFLIYDAHEFEAGRNTKRSYVSSLFTIYLERFLTKRTALNIMVNDTIADEVQNLHNLKDRPVVVRNVPPYWKIDKTVCEQKRKELIESMNVNGEQINFVAMYHGLLLNGRGIENLIRSVSKLSNVAAVILGNGEPSYVHALRKLVEREQVIDKILFHPYVPVENLWQYLGSVDVGIVNIENVCMSYYYSLPNKLLENIQSETPVIGSNFPEISNIINRYKTGLTCNPDDVNDIASAIEEMRNNKEQYATFKINLKIAKKELCWENEKMVLKSAFEKLKVINP